MVAAARPEPLPRVLLVDDEPDVLAAMALSLRRGYDVVTASSGPAGLAALADDPSIEVVISDMRMPGMTGAAWLARACEAGHDAVRMLLTGYADLDCTIEAINQGHVFRYLTKPCPRQVLESALAAAVAQYRLVAAERVLLEQTLHGSIKALVDVLGFTHPAVFGRASRIKANAIRIAAAAKLKERWQVEVAAMVADIGYVTLPPALAAKLEAGHVLSDAERQQAARIPQITEQLLANIPRLDEVRAILAAQDHPPRLDPAASPKRRLVVLGANILHAATALDALETADTPHALAAVARRDDLDPAVIAALRAMCGADNPMVVKEVNLGALRVGMVFAEDVRMASGALLVARGYEVTRSFLQRVANMTAGAIREPLRVAVAAVAVAA